MAGRQSSLHVAPQGNLPQGNLPQGNLPQANAPQTAVVGRWPICLVFEPASRFPDLSWAVIVAVALWSFVILSISGLGYLSGTEIIVCHLRRWTGWPCPMCGGTRMVLSLLSGQIRAALGYNPLLFLTLMGAVLWFGSRMLTGYRLWVQATPLGWCTLGCLGLIGVIANWIYLIARL